MKTFKVTDITTGLKDTGKRVGGLNLDSAFLNLRHAVWYEGITLDPIITRKDSIECRLIRGLTRTTEIWRIEEDK